MKPLPLFGQAPAAPASGWPGLRLAFRPFYLLAALAAVVLMPLWWAVFTGRLAPVSGLGPVAWHGHEMLFGVVAAVVVGFVFTAGKTWTGLPTPRGVALGGFVLLWLAGRVASLLAPYPVFFLLDATFLPLVAVVFLRLLLRAGNRRNLVVAGLLALLGVANLAFHLAATGVLAWSPTQALHAGLGLLVLLETLMAGRVVPFFTRNVTPGLQNTVPAWRERLLGAATTLALLAWLADLGVAVPLLLVAAALHAWRLHSWRPGVTLTRPILWSLHLAYAWIPLGLALLALALVQGQPVSPALHAFAVGATGGLLIAMMTRTARGHTGRALAAGKTEALAYGLVALAAALRVALPLLAPAAYLSGMVAAGACFAAAFAIYLAVYARWLLTPRADGQDG
ncbi:MAG: NnrS family protein [Burkholderiales bacterium]|nr:NnrS family protein [Burkholderiales bacterium]